MPAAYNELNDQPAFTRRFSFTEAQPFLHLPGFCSSSTLSSPREPCCFLPQRLISFEPPSAASTRGMVGSDAIIFILLTLQNNCTHYRNAPAYYIYRRIAVLRWYAALAVVFAAELRVAVGYLMSSHCFDQVLGYQSRSCVCVKT